MIYQWREGARFKGDAQEIGERVEELRVRHVGKVTAAIVVKDAASKKSPLYPCFEWEDAKAANQYRLVQARRVLGSLVIVTQAATESSDERIVRAFVHVRHEGDAESVYTSVSVALQDPLLREQVLEQARREIVAWRERYSGYQELADVFAAIDESESVEGGSCVEQARSGEAGHSTVR